MALNLVAAVEAEGEKDWPVAESLGVIDVDIDANIFKSDLVNLGSRL